MSLSGIYPHYSPPILCTASTGHLCVSYRTLLPILFVLAMPPICVSMYIHHNNDNMWVVATVATALSITLANANRNSCILCVFTYVCVNENESLPPFFGGKFEQIKQNTLVNLYILFNIPNVQDI